MRLDLSLPDDYQRAEREPARHEAAAFDQKPARPISLHSSAGQQHSDKLTTGGEAALVAGPHALEHIQTSN